MTPGTCEWFDRSTLGHASGLTEAVNVARGPFGPQGGTGGRFLPYRGGLGGRRGGRFAPKGGGWGGRTPPRQHSPPRILSALLRPSFARFLRRRLGGRG